MLGWEFPPHISGGLGTACHGITRGLAQHDVDVTFVVPRAFGDEDAGATRIVGCNLMDFAAAAKSIVSEAEPEAGAVPEQKAAAPRARPRRVVTIDSALLPYLGAEAYERRLRSLEATAPESLESPESAEPPPEPSPAAMLPGKTGIAEGDSRHRVQTAKKPLEFQGQYGADLMAEVTRYAEVVGQFASTEDFDVVHAHDWMTYPAGITAARAAGKPLVAHMHACEYDRSGDAPNPSIVGIEQAGLDAADRVICVSHYTAEMLTKRYRVDPAKLRVVHNAVTQKEQIEGWHVTKASGMPVVLFLGRVTHQKGPTYFLEAAARVARVLPNVRFVMSGSGDMLPRMVERAASLGLAKHVRFTGFLAGADVERMYALADLYVMPSVSEPFGISPLEAMALDVPVLVSRQSGVAEILRSALKFDYWDVEDLANKILALLRFPALRAVLTGEGREELKGMRWDLRAGSVRKVYDEVVPAAAASLEAAAGPR